MDKFVPLLLLGATGYVGFELGKQVLGLDETSAMIAGAVAVAASWMWAKQAFTGFGINPMTGALQTALPGIATVMR